MMELNEYLQKHPDMIFCLGMVACFFRHFGQIEQSPSEKRMIGAQGLPLDLKRGPNSIFPLRAASFGS